jgi:hypothetical protein
MLKRGIQVTVRRTASPACHVEAGIERNGHQQAGNGTDQGEHSRQRGIAIRSGRQDNKPAKIGTQMAKREKRRA